MLKRTAMVLGLIIAGGCTASAGETAKDIKPEDLINKQTSLEMKSFSREVEFIDKRTNEVLYKHETGSGEINGAEVADALAADLDQPMVPAKITEDGQYSEGQKRVILDEDQTAEMLENIRAFDRTIALPIVENAPNVKPEDIAGITNHVIGEYKTVFDPSVKGRVHNIKLSSNAINNVLLGPGDRFYYNLILGERTEARGYQKAMEIVNKELVEGIGGGICQTSSTLYNAVDEAGLGIIELHHHSKQVGYVPKDKDATVSWGGPDFKFENTNDFPVLIRSAVDDVKGSITIQVLSANEPTKS
ncbi:VanW family protein [Metabacillus sp. 84]|uniref:VanW family protein n=1 Tax=Metabacillus sp. 84 TaxID=3404705 RepID=UPI003CF07D2F